MNTYVVAYVSLFDHDLKQFTVKAKSASEAMIIGLCQEGWNFEGADDLTLEEIKTEAFNGDTLISAYKI